MKRTRRRGGEGGRREGEVGRWKVEGEKRKEKDALGRVGRRQGSPLVVPDDGEAHEQQRNHERRHEQRYCLEFDEHTTPPRKKCAQNLRRP